MKPVLTLLWRWVIVPELAGVNKSGPFWSFFACKLSTKQGVDMARVSERAVYNCAGDSY